MRYRISDLSQMAGISSQTLRRYEEQGIIRSIRDEPNGYRYYRPHDLAAIMRVRMYRGYGFSLHEIERLFQDNLPGTVALFEARIKGLEWEKLFLERRTACAKKQLSDLQDLPNRVGTYTEVVLPPMYGLLYRKNQDMSRDSGLRKAVAQWAEFSPLVQPLLLIDRQDFLDERDRYASGLCIRQEDAQFCGLKPDKYSVKIDGGRCLHTVIRATGSLSFAAEGYLDIFREELVRRGLTLRGDMISSTLLATYTPEGELCHFQRVYLPILSV